MTLNPVNVNQSMSTAGAAGPKKSLGQEDFLKLMLAQVKNQDPLEPQTNGDFLAQMAQFSTNDSINKMSDNIDMLAYSLQSNQALQASSLVGRSVLVNSDKLTLGAEGEAKIAVDLPAQVNELTAYVYSPEGTLVNKIPLGQHDIGQFDFNWNGMNSKNERAPAGNYRIEVLGNYQGRDVALRTMTTANVDSVSLSNSGLGVQLNVAGIGAVSLSDVHQISA